MQFVGRFAFVVELDQAFVLRMLAREHAQFDKSFGHFPWKLALGQESSAAWLETGLLEAALLLVVPEHFDLKRKKSNVNTESLF